MESLKAALILKENVMSEHILMTGDLLIESSGSTYDHQLLYLSSIYRLTTNGENLWTLQGCLGLPLQLQTLE